MKNKSTMLLLGIGVAYLLYRLYAKKTTAPVTTTATPKVLYATENLFEVKGSQDSFYPYNDGLDKINVPKQLLVDTATNAPDILIPSTYQTYYGKINGNYKKVPQTC